MFNNIWHMYLYHIPYTSYIYFLTPWGSLHQIFCGAFFGNAPFVSEQKSFLSNQVEILNQAIKHHVHCFVFTSSIAVYGSINAPRRRCFWRPKGWFAQEVSIQKASGYFQKNLNNLSKMEDHKFSSFQVSNSLSIASSEDLSQMQNPNRSLATSGHRRSLQQGLLATGAYHLPSSDSHLLTFLSWHMPGLKEEDRPTPEDPYGIAKYAFELDLHAAKELFGIDFVIFRPHNVYGPHQVWIQKVWRWDWLREVAAWTNMLYVVCLHQCSATMYLSM